MTIIVFDGKTLAADKMVSDSTGYYTTKKIGRLNDGSLYGFCGYPHQAAKIIAWLNRDRKLEEYPEQTERDLDACVLVITKDRKKFLYNSIAGSSEVADKYVVLGSGQAYALAGLHCGLDAKKAVKLAIKLCPTCGGGIDSITAN